MFVVTAALIVPALLDAAASSAPATASWTTIRRCCIRASAGEREHRPWHIFHDPTLHVFAVCVVLFHFANAAMLPLALNELSKRVDAVRLRGLGGDHRAADRGRGVLALGGPPGAAHRPQADPAGRLRRAAAARAAVRRRSRTPIPLVAIQALDGVSATVFGLIVPLIAADLTRRTGYLNLAIGALGLAAGLGATASTTAAGWLADTLRAPAAFLGLALVGLAALATVWLMMPETRPGQTRCRRETALPPPLAA